MFSRILRSWKSQEGISVENEGLKTPLVFGGLENKEFFFARDSTDSWSRKPGPRGAAAQRLDCDMFEQINKKVHENKRSLQKQKHRDSKDYILPV